MSKVKIQGNASGTGVVTLTAPNTDTDRTITLPDSTGTVLDSTSTLDATKLSGDLPAIDGSSLTGISGGKVLQVVTSTFTSGYVTSTAGSNDVASTDGYGLFAVSFTPTSASSKIIISSSTVSIHEEANNYNSCWVASFYDTTRIAVTSGTWHSNSNFVSSYNAAYFSINHSVSSWGTSAKTINIRAGMDGSSGTFHINGSSLYNMSGQAQIGLTIMEVEV